ncbi:MAG TPA: hypothetical protein EYQ27_00710 [Gemmatimonadetes bacterium]|nr:hypothetical protein [Gemmatimonadota bacterium]
MSEPSVMPIEESEKHLLRNLMQAYRHDMSEFDGSNPDESGSFDLGNYFEVSWTEPARHPFKVLVGDVLAGFALVPELAPQTHAIAEFFIRRQREPGVCVADQQFRGPAGCRRAGTSLLQPPDSLANPLETLPDRGPHFP